MNVFIPVHKRARCLSRLWIFSNYRSIRRTAGRVWSTTRSSKKWIVVNLKSPDISSWWLYISAFLCCNPLFIKMASLTVINAELAGTNSTLALLTILATTFFRIWANMIISTLYNQTFSIYQSICNFLSGRIINWLYCCTCDVHLLRTFILC